MMENKHIDEIRERLDSATPSPWSRHDTIDYSEIHNTNTWGEALSAIALVGYGEDADFIAHAPTDMAYLLTLIEEKDKQIAELEKERDAAVDATTKIIKKHVDEICLFCKNEVKCGESCDFYEKGVGATGKDGEVYPDFKWSCMDFDFGTCRKLEGTACEGCYDNDYSGFECRGIQEEE